MSDIKLCINCKFAEERVGFHCIDRIPYQQIIYVCNRNADIDLVDGTYIGNKLFCDAERENALRLENYRCGPQAKFFEAKEVK
jgi:hypothetical protein